MVLANDSLPEGDGCHFTTTRTRSRTNRRRRTTPVWLRCGTSRPTGRRPWPRSPRAARSPSVAPAGLVLRARPRLLVRHDQWLPYYFCVDGAAVKVFVSRQILNASSALVVAGERTNGGRGSDGQCKSEKTWCIEDGGWSSYEVRWWPRNAWAAVSAGQRAHRLGTVTASGGSASGG
jgi:hypothetical protein